MPSKLKRVSEASERAITDLAHREGRTFVAQLDRVIDAGLTALGERQADNGREPQPSASNAP